MPNVMYDIQSICFPSPPADRWTQEDMLTLLECMKNNLPSNDGSKFKTTESHLDWDKVAFKDFSSEMCKMKWNEISNEVAFFILDMGL